MFLNIITEMRLDEDGDVSIDTQCPNTPTHPYKHENLLLDKDDQKV